MVSQEDVIVDIPANRIRFFGTTGKMLLPCPATIKALIAQVPEHQLLTMDLLQKKLTDQFHVQGVCPVTTRKSLQTVASDMSSQVAYWRVVKKNGELISYFPGGLDGQVELLKGEGFIIDTDGKHPKIRGFAQHLTQLDQAV